MLESFPRSLCEAILPPMMFKHAEQFIDFLPDYESDSDSSEGDSPCESDYNPDESMQKSNLSEQESLFRERFSNLDIQEDETNIEAVDDEDQDDTGPILVLKEHQELLNKVEARSRKANFREENKSEVDQNEDELEDHISARQKIRDKINELDLLNTNIYDENESDDVDEES
jgi:hypothetical protein